MLLKISGGTVFYKWIVPAIVISSLAQLVAELWASRAGTAFYIVPVLMAMYMLYWLRRTVWNLIDPVFDDGSELVFRHKGKERRVPYCEILNVDYAHMMSPQRVAIRFRLDDAAVREEITFTPPFRFGWTKHSYIKDLIERIDEARRHNPAAV